MAMTVENKTPETAYLSKDNIIDPSHTYGSDLPGGPTGAAAVAHRTKADLEAAAGDIRAVNEIIIKDAAPVGALSISIGTGSRKKGR